MKKLLGKSNLNPNSVNIHSTEKDPLSTKSPLNNCKVELENNCEENKKRENKELFVMKTYIRIRL